MKRNLAFFMVVSILILGLVLGISIRGIKSESIVENKKLANFPSFTVKGFFDTSYQTNMEEALSDQLILGQTLKRSYNQLKNKNLEVVVSFLKQVDNQSNKIKVLPKLTTEQRDEGVKDYYFEIAMTPKGNGLMEIDESKHLIYPQKTLEDAEALFESKANNYNQLVANYPEIQFYSYYIETDLDVDFVKGEINHKLSKRMFELLDDRIHLGMLAINNPVDYQNYFYKTDHHWDLEGQFEGYKGIVTLVKGEMEPMKDIEMIVFPDIKYNGYKSRKIDDYSISDSFGILKSELSEHDVWINGEAKQFGRKQVYEQGKYAREQGYNYYADCYGYDFGKVAYAFNQPKEKNLLVFGESFANPIKELVAAHFNNTFYVDLRHYEEFYRKPFDFGDFIEENDIDQVLFTGYYYFYANDTFLIND